MLSFINFWFTAFLFAGFFVREADVIWPFKAFVYILPLRWSIAAIVRSEFEVSSQTHTPSARSTPNGPDL